MQTYNSDHENNLERTELLQSKLSSYSIVEKDNESSIEASKVKCARISWAAIVVLTIIGALVLDLLLLMDSSTSPTVHSVEVFLDSVAPSPATQTDLLSTTATRTLLATGSTASQDARMEIEGSFAFKSYTTRIELTSAECSYYYSNTNIKEPKHGGNLDVTFTQTGQDIRATILLQNTNFSTVRQMALDVDTAMKTRAKRAAEGRLHDQADESEKYKPVFSVRYKLNFDVIAGGGLIRHSMSHEGKTDVDFSKKGPQQSPIGRLEDDKPPTFSLSQPSLAQVAERLYEFSHSDSATLKPVLSMSGPLINPKSSGIKSFLIHVPALSYDVTMVDNPYDATQSSSTLRLTQHPLDMELTRAFETAMKLDLGCTSNAATVATAADAGSNEREEGESEEKKDDTMKCNLLQPFAVNDFSNALVHRKFINSTLTAKSNNFVTALLGPYHYFSVQPATSQSAATSAVAAHPISSLVAPPPGQVEVDDVVSSGSNCVLVDTDGAYYSHACSEVEKNFFKLALTVYNNRTGDNLVGHMESLTRWQVNGGPVAFISDLNVSYTNVGSALASVAFSSEMKNMSIDLIARKPSGSVSCTVAGLVDWDFSNAASEGFVHGVSVATLANNDTTFDSTFEIDYAYDTYHIGSSVTSFNQDGELQENILLVQGKGGYGGNLNNFWLSLDNSTLISDDSDIGSAIASVAVRIPASGASGDISFNNKVVEGNQGDLVLTNAFKSEWYSPAHSWKKDGVIAVVSDFNLVNQLDWNTTGAFNYSVDTYFLDFLETSNKNKFIAFATGEYQFHAWNNWYFSLDEALIVSDDFSLVPTGSALVDVASSGQSGNIRLITDVIKGGGGTQMPTAAPIVAPPIGSPTVYPTQAPFTGASCAGKCGGGTGSCYCDSVCTKYGDCCNDYAAVCLGTSPSSGSDNSPVTLLNTYGNLAWFSDAGSWTKTGSISAASNFYWQDHYEWDASASLDYNPTTYLLTALEGTDTNNFYLYGTGPYAFPSDQHWYISLTESELILSNATEGSSVGTIKWDGSGGSAQGDFNVETSTFDANSNPVLLTASTVSLASSSQWIEDGSIQLFNVFNLVGIINGSVTGDFNYADNTYSFSVDQVSTKNSLFATAVGYYHVWSPSHWNVSVDNSNLVLNNVDEGYIQGSLAVKVNPDFTWGAVDAVTHTWSSASTGSCSGACGGYGGGCWCDSLCSTYNDCCADINAVCSLSANSPSAAPTVAGPKYGAFGSPYLNTALSTSWNTQNKWSNSGAVNVSSSFDLIDQLMWSVYGNISYADGEYMFAISELANSGYPPYEDQAGDDYYYYYYYYYYDYYYDYYSYYYYNDDALADDQYADDTFAIDANIPSLFAIVGPNACAEDLWYGPSNLTHDGSADGHPYYFSTGNADRAAPSTEWLQIVTATDRVTELFRIYWAFTDAQTIEDRFLNAQNGNVLVDYRVIEPDGTQTTYTNVQWMYSNNAQLSTNTFSSTESEHYFSNDDGAWGAACHGCTVNGNSERPSLFSGQANWNGGDGNCGQVFLHGNYIGKGVSFMYDSPYYVAPSMSPTISLAPTSSPVPTVVPTSTNPTTRPTEQPTNTNSDAVSALFAIIGPNACAESLYYGPELLDESGTSNGYQYYLSTLNSDTSLSAEWMQVVTQLDGVTEYFKIYWSFSDTMTMEDRFLTAQSNGVYVDYRLVEPDGTTTYYTNVLWQYSNSAGLTSQEFAVTSTSYGFSNDDGAWGSANSGTTINGNSQMASGFSGQANWNGGDGGCGNVYLKGQYIGTGMSFLYDSCDVCPTMSPTASPAPSATPVPSSSPAPSRSPTIAPTAFPTTLLLTAYYDSQFSVEVCGRYDFVQLYDWLMTVDKGLISSDFTDVALFQGTASVDSVSSGTYGTVALSFVDYSNSEAVIYKDMPYNIGDSIVWAINSFEWDTRNNYIDTQTTSHVLYNAQPYYTVDSSTKIDLIADHAFFEMQETYKGNAAWAAVAQCNYDMDYGMLADIVADVTFKGVSVWGFNSAWDMQLQTNLLNTSMPSLAPTKSPTELPTRVPTGVPTKPPSAAPSFTPSLVPSTSPTEMPTRVPTGVPTKPPSAAPSFTPSLVPSTSPTEMPTRAPTVPPTERPSPEPSLMPSASPTVSPTFYDSCVGVCGGKAGSCYCDSECAGYGDCCSDYIGVCVTEPPSAAPTMGPHNSHMPTQPSMAPSKVPTEGPTRVPSAVPSETPSCLPTKGPHETNAPTVSPTNVPTKNPAHTDQPSVKPSPAPSAAPTPAPSCRPTSLSTVRPSRDPSANPTSTPAPSQEPSTAPTTATPTVSPTFYDSCVGVCGGKAGSCFCDSECAGYGDCCSDYIGVCVTEPPSAAPTLGPHNSQMPTQPSMAPSKVPTEGPTRVPSAVPSETPSCLPTKGPHETNAPTVSPSAVPSRNPALSYKPTAEPSFAPSATPTWAPSAVPSKLSTVRPTRDPTVAPTFTNMPSAAPSRSPSHLPSATLSRSPSIAPVVTVLTVQPTSSGTNSLRPSGSSPSPSSSSSFRPSSSSTIAPTDGNTIVFAAQQTLTGISLSVYSSSSAYEESVAETIAACMNGVSYGMVSDLVAVDGTPATTTTPTTASAVRRHLVDNVRLRKSSTTTVLADDDSSTSAIDISYIVTANVVGATYESLTTELNANIDNGVYNSYLMYYGNLNGATQLAGVSASEASTDNETPTTSSSSSNSGKSGSLSAGGAAGVSIAVIAFVGLLGALAYYYRASIVRAIAGGDGATSDRNVKSGKSVAEAEAIELQDVRSTSTSTGTKSANPMHASGDRM